jgi:putative ABC transport system permease protein
MGAMLNDLRSGLRIMRAHPSFTAVVVIILALGIGANTTIFSVINALLFYPIPFKDADRLVSITESSERLRGGGPTSYPTFLDWKNQNQVFDDMAVFSYEAVNLAEGGEPERLGGLRVSEKAIPLLGANPVLGRAFLSGEYAASGDRVVLLSHGLWQRRFGAKPGAVGQTVKVNGQMHTIVGVLPADLRMAMTFGFEPALWLPLVPAASGDRGARSCLAVAHLKSGITMERARADMDVIARRIAESHPDTNKGWTTMVSPLRPEVDTIAYVLLGILVCSILGLVCANVINLLLARATGREREIAVRAALGASRMRLVRQLLTENLLLLLVGCGTGVMAAAWACDLISSRFVDTNLGALRIRIDAQVLAATMLLFLLAGAMVGVVPALQLSRAGLNRSLKEGNRSQSGSSSKRRFKSFLVASEVAFSLMLLMGASLAVKSWSSLWNIDLGFRPENVLAMRISLADPRYADSNRQVAFFQDLLRRLQTRSEIRSAGVASDLPAASPERSFTIAERPLPAPGEAPRARYTVVSAGYFNTMTLSLKAGRQFTEQDVASAPAVTIVNEALARRYWNGQSPIGSRIEVAGALRTIVGVAGDVKSIPLSLKPVPEIFVPFTQAPGGDMALVVETTLSDPLPVAGAVKQEVLAVDADQPVSRIMTMEKACTSNMGAIKLGTFVLSLVALGALILAVVGIYGVLSFSVSQRTHEIGLRMALGAQPRDVLRSVLRQGMMLTILGILPGLAASLALGRVLSSSLFGVAPVEILVLAGISLLLVLVALVACYLPARRAAAVDPMQALRAL